MPGPTLGDKAHDTFSGRRKYKKIILTVNKIHMKKLIAFVFTLVLFTSVSLAQRYAVIDTKYILGKIPDYVDADKKLQAVSEQWQKEIDDRQSEMDKMYKDYDAEQFMLSD